MECKNIDFPELEYSSPGTYEYTVRELTPSNKCWLTDDRIYRVIVTVTKNVDGRLVAEAEYPDGFPRFVNIYCPPPKPPEPEPGVICECFHKLPFPFHWFAPPSKTMIYSNE